jgi:hypothetical protein
VAEVYNIVLQLGDIQHLFTKPDLSPLSDDYQAYSHTSGIEFIADELYANPRYASVRATIRLPASNLEPGLEEKVRAAVRRYCKGRLQYIEHDIGATRWRGVRTLFAGLLALFLFVGAAKLVGTSENLVLGIVSEGLAIAGWVALWFPLETLAFKVWEHRLDRRVYSRVMDMDLVIQPAD